MPQTQTIDLENKTNMVESVRITEPTHSEANISKNGVVYFPFNNENETIDWICNVVSEWWDDETICNVVSEWWDDETI